MKQKKVDKILYAVEVQMGDIPIRQPLPNAGTEHADPFLLIHHHYSTNEPGLSPFDFGVGPHPHRGFSPVTVIYKGEVHHRDSRDNDRVVKEGGIQWLNAGMGIVHSERPSDEFAMRGGEQEIIQLWVNLPAANKLDTPSYFAIDHDDIPVTQSPEKNIRIRVLAGVYNGMQGHQHKYSDLLMLDIFMKAGTSYNFKLTEGWTTLLYNLDRRINIESYGILDGHYLASLSQEGDELEIRAEGDTRILLLSGAPLKETIQSYGPFVMNNQTEIMQAIKDYQMGKMGMLIEEVPAGKRRHFEHE